ncbi:hypothetical protein A5893_00065 [Pedobacter psychrophilus]|uniref:Uncharacterized protein n=1 Tax=Pedobacter psychrophilus TaxID=1826909 RepID=A0A179DKA2_9SPHI|nr:hypothetical protein [Pedobacter psychrophilus]OAQ41547.1 hypothetical protein A5893_00065 [Pedobacter psychrophilus]
MENTQDPKDLKKNADDVKITNDEDKIVNKQTENVHEATNQEEWAHDVNEQFGDDFILPEDEDDVVN